MTARSSLTRLGPPATLAVVAVRVVIFDLDGTLIDSDQALVEPFVALGVPPEEISFGHPIEIECQRLGIPLDAYVEAYDDSRVAAFPGVDDLLGRLDRWAVCSNKHPRSGQPELDRFGWRPELAFFADAFGWLAKSVEPVLAALGVDARDALFVGDTDHDRHCSERAGVRFAWAGWNPRVGEAVSGLRLVDPADVLALVGEG